MSRRAIVAAILTGCLIVGNPLYAIQQPTTSKPSPNAAALRIVVVNGEDAVNIIQQKTAVAPLVEVRDRNNQPVAGALVTFTIQGGGNATFAGASTVTATTNALGQAAAASFTPTSAGAVQINVAAAFQGQTATAAITQTNFMTAAQAAAAGSSASSTSGAAGSAGGGGGMGAGTITTLGLVGAGVAGGYYAYRKYEMGEAPAITALRFFPEVGIAAITPVLITNDETTWHGDGASIVIEFGDGVTVTLPMPPGPDTHQQMQHVYQAPGTYHPRMTIRDAWDRTASAQGTVTIKGLTGRWSVGSTGSFFSLTQNGTSIGGSFAAASGQGSGVVTGTGNSQGLGTITLSVAPVAGLPTTFRGSPDPSGDVIAGQLTVGQATTSVQLVRQ